MRKNVVANMPN